MTRINLVNVQDLADQHLVAEWRELPRIVKAAISGRAKLNQEIPPSYTFNGGHVRFFYNKLDFLCQRFKQLTEEMHFRGFRTSYTAGSLQEELDIACRENPTIAKYRGSYVGGNPTEVFLSISRIVNKIEMKPKWYRWTKREVPMYLKEIVNAEH